MSIFEGAFSLGGASLPVSEVPGSDTVEETKEHLQKY